MLQAYLRHLHRDRRRVFLAVALLLAAGHVSGDTLPEFVPWLSTEAMIVIAGLVLIPLTTLVFHRHRHWIEIVLFADLSYAVLAHLLPGSWFDYHGLTTPLPLNAMAWLATVFVSRLLLYGSWSDRFTPKHQVQPPATHFHSSASVADLWYGLLAMPGHLNRFADPDVISADYADAAHRVVRMVTWRPPSPLVVMLVHLDEIEPMKRVRMRFEVVEGPRDVMLGGTVEMRITDAGNWRRVTLGYEGAAIPPRRILRMVLDDTIGRIFDIRINAIERGIYVGGRLQMDDEFAAWFDEPEMVEPPRDRRRLAAQASAAAPAKAATATNVTSDRAAPPSRAA